MKEVVEVIVKLGIPALVLVLGAACLVLGLYHITFTPEFSYVRQAADVPILVIAFVLLFLSIILWFIDPTRNRLKTSSALDGHYNLIRFLRGFASVNDFRPPGTYVDRLGQATADKYAVLYLEFLGLLEKNHSGSEYMATDQARKILASADFISRNAGAFNDG
jgi:hypothetical protein